MGSTRRGLARPVVSSEVKHVHYFDVLFAPHSYSR